jgi:hypothetical protein
MQLWKFKIIWTKKVSITQNLVSTLKFWCLRFWSLIKEWWMLRRFAIFSTFTEQVLGLKNVIFTMIPSDVNIYPLLSRHGNFTSEKDSCNYVTNRLTFIVLKNYYDHVYQKYHVLRFMLSRLSTRKFIWTNKQYTL